jgi:hypothetical protein
MKKPVFQGQSRVVRRTAPALFLLFCAPLLSACAAGASDSPGAGALPSPGTIAIVTAPTLAARARVPEKEPGFVSAEVHEHLLTIEHDSAFLPLSVGDVLGGTAGGGYLVRVLAVRAVDATHVELATAPAALPELIAEGEFHVHYDAADFARRLDESLVESRAAADEGEGGERIARQAQALMASAGATIDLLSLVHAKLPPSCRIQGEGGGALDLDATARLTPVVDLDVKIGSPGGLNPIPELQRFRLVVGGKLDVSARLRGSGTITGGCSIDLLALAGGAVSVPLPTLTFWVGPVPVIVTTDVVPRATARLDLAFSGAEVAVEAQTTTALDVGVDYEDDAWSTIWDPTCKATGKASIQAPGAITAACEVSAGAELRARLYGVLGPNVGVEAYARVGATTEAPYCTYEAATEGGVRAFVQAEAGVSVGPFDISLARLDLVNLDLVRFDGPQLSGALRDAPECGGE